MIYLKLITVVSILANIGLLCRYVHSLDASPQKKACDHNLQDSQDMIGICDKTKKLNQRLDDAPRLKMQNNPEFSNFKTTNEPYTAAVNKANLQSITKQSKPSHKNSEKRKRLSKNSASKSKPIIDKVNNKVMILDYGPRELPNSQTSQQDSQVRINDNPCKSPNVNREMHEANNNLNYDVNETGQNLINKDINDCLNTMTNSVNLTQDDINKKCFLDNIILPNDFEFTQKDKNEIGNTYLILSEAFTEELQTQNKILKELLSKIIHSQNVTNKAAYESNTRRVHLVLDINNVGSRNFDLELNPIFKFRDDYGQINLNVALADDRNSVKILDKSNGELYSKTNGPENVLSYFAHNNYGSYHYTNPVEDVPTSSPVLNENEPSNMPWNYNYNFVHNVTPQKIKDSISTSFKDRATVPQQSFYNGYIYSPFSQLYSKPYNSYQNPLYTYYGLQGTNF